MDASGCIHTSRGSRLLPRTRASAASLSNASGSRTNSPTLPTVGGSSTTQTQAPGGAGHRLKKIPHAQAQGQRGGYKRGLAMKVVRACVCMCVYLGVARVRVLCVYLGAVFVTPSVLVLGAVYECTTFGS